MVSFDQTYFVWLSLHHMYVVTSRNFCMHVCMSKLAVLGCSENWSLWGSPRKWEGLGVTGDLVLWTSWPDKTQRFVLCSYSMFSIMNLSEGGVWTCGPPDQAGCKSLYCVLIPCFRLPVCVCQRLILNLWASWTDKVCTCTVFLSNPHC